MAGFPVTRFSRMTPTEKISALEPKRLRATSGAAYPGVPTACTVWKLVWAAACVAGDEQGAVLGNATMWDENGYGG